MLKRSPPHCGKQEIVEYGKSVFAVYHFALQPEGAAGKSFPSTLNFIVYSVIFYFSNYLTANITIYAQISKRADVIFNETKIRVHKTRIFLYHDHIMSPKEHCGCSVQ